MRHMNWLVGSLMLGATLAGCGDPPLSEVASAGGSTTDPAGLLEGTVQYIGPRPLCEYVKGQPTKLRGVGAILVLYGFDDEPPPNGPRPASVLVVPMGDFFASLSQCMPEDPTPADLHVSVTASAPYTWPRIPLGQGLSKRAYRVEAVFDRDGDYYPLLPITNGIHTAGDAIGGATIGFGRDWRKIEFGGLCEAEIGKTGRDNGQVVKGVAVTIALPLWTERQMFEVKQTNPRKYLSSEQTIDLGQGEWGDALPPPILSPDPMLARKNAYLRLRKFAGLELNLIDNKRAALDCKDPADPKADGTDKCVGPRLKRLGIDYDLLDQKSYAWHLWPYDTNGDGYTELHPPLSFAFGPPFETAATPAAAGFFYSVQTPWTLPLVALSRIKSTEEKLAAIPDASLLGGVDKFAQEEKSVYFPTLPVSIVPTVAISTKKIDANKDRRNDCDVDVYPPGNFNVTYQVPGRYSDCQELPIGDYSILTLTGVAGNVVYKEDARSQTGWNLAQPDDNNDGKADPFVAAGVGQIWLHPNDLGDATKFVDGFGEASDKKAQDQAKAFALDSQGRASAFKIRDPNPDNSVRPLVPDETQEPVMGKAISDCDVAVVPGMPVKVAKIEYPKIPASCCAPETVALCGLKRCAVADDGNLAPTRLRAWVTKSAVNPSDFDAADDIMKLDEQALTLEEAAKLTAAGGTAIFRGTFVEAAANEEADLVIPRKGYNPKNLQYISYSEYVAQDDSMETVAYPDCEDVRSKAGEPAKPEQPSSTVRLKIAQLEPTCVPFLIPVGCCEN